MIPAIASRIPLVRRPKTPALPLDERIAHLTGLTIAPAGAGHHDLVTRASGALNYAALIASDVGMPDLAAKLCWRQHQVFADAKNLTGDIAVMALMPLTNISRLLTREGDGEAARDVLNHHPTRSHLTNEQRQKFDAVLTASGLDTGNLSTDHSHALTAAVDKAEAALRGLL